MSLHFLRARYAPPSNRRLARNRASTWTNPPWPARGLERAAADTEWSSEHVGQGPGKPPRARRERIGIGHSLRLCAYTDSSPRRRDRLHLNLIAVCSRDHGPVRALWRKFQSSRQSGIGAACDRHPWQARLPSRTEPSSRSWDRRQMQPSPSRPPFNKTGAAVAVRVLQATKELRRYPFRSYAMAFVTIGLATLLQWAMRHEYDGAPFLTIYPAIIVAALIGGRGPGFLAAILAGRVAVDAVHSGAALACRRFLRARRHHLRHVDRLHQPNARPPARPYRSGETGQATSINTGEGTASPHPEPVHRDSGRHPLQSAGRWHHTSCRDSRTPDGPIAIDVRRQSGHHGFDVRRSTPARSHQRRNPRLRNAIRNRRQRPAFAQRATHPGPFADPARTRHQRPQIRSAVGAAGPGEFATRLGQRGVDLRVAGTRRAASGRTRRVRIRQPDTFDLCEKLQPQGRGKLRASRPAL